MDPIFGPLIEEVSEAMYPFREKIVEAERVRAALALAEQKRIAIANGRIQRRFMEGIGEVVASFGLDVWYRLGVIHGFDTIRQPDFLAAMLRDNPELRVQSRSEKTQIRVPEWNREEPVVSEVDTGAAPLEREDAQYFHGSAAA